MPSNNNTTTTKRKAEGPVPAEGGLGAESSKQHKADDAPLSKDAAVKLIKDNVKGCQSKALPDVQIAHTIASAVAGVPIDADFDSYAKTIDFGFQLASTFLNFKNADSARDHFSQNLTGLLNEHLENVRRGCNALSISDIFKSIPTCHPYLNRSVMVLLPQYSHEEWSFTDDGKTSVLKGPGGFKKKTTGSLEEHRQIFMCDDDDF